MAVALRIIAICEVIRIVQNILRLRMVWHDTGARDNAYAEFVKSLKSTDKEFVRQLLEEFENEFDDEKKDSKDIEVQCRYCGHHKEERPCEVFCAINNKWVTENSYCTHFENGNHYE